ncbi:hypothetical protein HT031_005585 [Scenedesmus sp. PABB004]|nr:hypothetical protein HT031_005585 [Scenedesmus sp. PABB004]
MAVAPARCCRGAAPPGAARAPAAAPAARVRRCRPVAPPLRATAAGGAPDLDLDGLYRGGEPVPYVGAVRAVRLKAGVGVEATRTVPAGETLLVSVPLALLAHDSDALDDAGEGGDAPYTPSDADVDALAEQLAAARGARAQAWLQHLDDGSLDAPGGGAAQPPDLAALAALRGDGGGGGEAARGDDALLDVADVAARALEEDGALAVLSRRAPRTLVGVWPELSLVPHSCAPNAALVAHGGAAVVTAARAVPKQSVVSVNLLGSAALAPLDARARLLSAATGAACACPRCRDEGRQDAQLRALVADVHEACELQIAPELADAVEADDGAALEGLRDQLASFCEVVDAGFSKLGVSPGSQVWLQASLFKLYELTAVATAACGEVDARLLALLAALAGEVVPGSAEHVFWARQYRDEVAADEEAAFDGGLREAEAQLRAAVCARYGASIGRELCLQLAAGTEDGGGEDEDEE